MTSGIDVVPGCASLKGKRAAEQQLITLQQQTLSAVNTLVDVQRQLLEVKKEELEVQRELVGIKRAKMAANGWFQDEHGNWVGLVKTLVEE